MSINKLVAGKGKAAVYNPLSSWSFSIEYKGLISTGLLSHISELDSSIQKCHYLIQREHKTQKQHLSLIALP